MHLCVWVRVYFWKQSFYSVFHLEKLNFLLAPKSRWINFNPPLIRKVLLSCSMSLAYIEEHTYTVVYIGIFCGTHFPKFNLFRFIFYSWGWTGGFRL